MRKIVFRGKSLRTEKWIQGYLFRCWERAYIAWGMVNDNADMKEVDPETVCQYTGLTDKNSRKIFEGDMVRYTDEAIGKEKVDEIEYNETHAAFCRLHKSERGLQYIFIDESIANRCEVIGNIFDNPSLIGGKEK